jgi:peptidoglycan/LPS O-acetylase OafA/YrhL
MHEQDTRLHSLDAVRAFALLLGIVLHATMSFMPVLTSAGFPIADRSQSEFLQGTFFVIHIFRMTMFFFIAGFFARKLYHKLGTAGFIKNRTRRVLVPLVIGWGVLLPATIVVFLWAIRNNGSAPTPPAASSGSFPLMHLWFLYLLCLFYLSVLVLRWMILRVTSHGLRARLDAAVAWLTGQPLIVVPLALPVAACLYFQKEWIAFGGIPTPDTSLVPNLPAFIGYATAFSFGWLLQRQSASLANFGRTRWAHLGLSIVLSLVLLNWIPDSRLTLALVYAIASWSWTFAIVGAAAQFMSRDRPAIRYLADSSYWMYLVHLPLVFALQEAMSEWALHWSLKFPLLIAIAMTVLLASYHRLVRFTFIGKALNGKRYARHSPQVPASVGAMSVAE